MDFETLLRKRNQQGEHLIGLWLCEATITNREENEQLKKKITKVKRDLKEICSLLAEGDAEYGVILYRAYIRLLDQKNRQDYRGFINVETRD